MCSEVLRTFGGDLDCAQKPLDLKRRMLWHTLHKSDKIRMKAEGSDGIVDWVLNGKVSRLTRNVELLSQGPGTGAGTGIGGEVFRGTFTPEKAQLVVEKLQDKFQVVHVSSSLLLKTPSTQHGKSEAEAAMPFITDEERPFKLGIGVALPAPWAKYLLKNDIKLVVFRFSLEQEMCDLYELFRHVNRFASNLMDGTTAKAKDVLLHRLELDFQRDRPLCLEWMNDNPSYVTLAKRRGIPRSLSAFKELIREKDYCISFYELNLLAAYFALNVIVLSRKNIGRSPDGIKCINVGSVYYLLVFRVGEADRDTYRVIKRSFGSYTAVVHTLNQLPRKFAQILLDGKCTKYRLEGIGFVPAQKNP
jgi:hypothetical protein